MFDPRPIIVTLAALAFACGGSSDPVPVWDGSFSTAMARTEHPRPDLRRDTYVSLNTRWQFAFDPDDAGVREKWYRSAKRSIWTDTVQVPFAWDSPLSGLVPAHEGEYRPFENLGATSYRGVAWYRLELPGSLEDLGDRSWHLVFGAVDHAATVFVNGKEAARHEGGYSSFAVDLSPYVRPLGPVVIVVRVEDFGDTDDANLAQPVGKQGGFWYTRTSGIWQSVYLEARPAQHIAHYRVTSSLDQGRVSIRVSLEDSDAVTTVRATIASEGESDQTLATGEATASGGTAELAIDVPDPQPWSPSSPTLYALTLESESNGVVDRVHGYFGMVEVRTDWVPGHGPSDAVASEDQWQALFVNGEPRYLSCVLDQSYWPDGVLTAPSYEEMRADALRARSLGFNCVRVHVKTDEPLKYRIFDELGMFVIYDFVSLDLRAANTGASFAGRELFEVEALRALERDANHPSIVMWVVFNENWGLSSEGGGFISPLADSADTLDWASSMVAAIRSADPSRPVEDNSAGGIVGRYEHFDTDVNSFHWYGTSSVELRAHLDEQAAATYPGSTTNFIAAPQTGAPWMISEVGPLSVVGQASEASFCTLWSLINEVRRQPKLTGYVVTQLTDVEFEENGLFGYDRADKSLCDRAEVPFTGLTGEDFIAFEDGPGRVVPAAQAASFGLRFAQWSTALPQPVRVVVHWAGAGDESSVELTSMPYVATAVPALQLTTPSTAGPAVVIAEVFDAADNRLAINRLEVEVEVAE